MGGITDWINNATDWWDAHTNPFHDLFGPSESEQKKIDQGQAPSEPGILVQPVEKAMSAMAWTRDNVVSRPLTTLELMIDKAGSHLTGNEIFSPKEWQSSWDAAQHVSPGQALLYDPFNKTGDYGARELERAPLEYKRPAGLPQGFNDMPWQQQQDTLKAAGMAVQGNSAVEAQRRQNPLFKYGSGIVDFGLSMKADPTVLLGKAAGAAKAAAFTTKIEGASDIGKVMQSDAMTKTQQYVWANRDNPQLLNNLPIARDSAMGPRFGVIASKLQSPEELNLFLRTGMGDVAARNELMQRNSLVAGAIEQDSSRMSALGMMRSRYGNQPAMQGMIDQEMARLNQRINDNADMVDTYRQIVGGVDPSAGSEWPGIANTIDKVTQTRWQFAQAEQRTAAQNAYQAGAGRRAGAAAELANLPSVSVVSRAPRPVGAGLIGRVAPSEQGALTSPITDLLPGGGQLPVSRIYSNFFSTPLTMVRSFMETRPSGHIAVDSIDQDSVNNLRGFVARIPGLTSEDRGRIVNAYLQSGSEGERANLLDGVERQAMRAVAGRHGFTTDEADAIYQEHQARVGVEKKNLVDNQQYSAATMPSGTGGRIPVDAFDDGGGGYVIHPNLVSRLINDKQMVNLDHYDRILSRYGSALQALRVPLGEKTDAWVRAGSDFFNSAWKFGELFRLGSIPRVMAADDLAGQVAALGAASMLNRIGWGIKNGATNMALAAASPALQAREAVLRSGLDYANGELADVSEQIGQAEKLDAALKASNARAVGTAQQRLTAAQSRLAGMTPVTDPFDPGWAKYSAAVKMVTRHQGALGAAQLRANTGLSPGKLTALDTLKNQRDFLQAKIAEHEQAIQDSVDARQKVMQGNAPINLGDIAPGFTMPGALTGQRGELYAKKISSEDTMNMLFKPNKELIHGNLLRTWDHGANNVNAVRDPAGHMAAWLHVINAQFGNDALARQALGGASADQMADWLANTADGRLYMRRLGEELATPQRVAQGVHYDVNTTAPTAGIRAAALTPDGVTADQLAAEMPDLSTRPDVHRGLLAANLAGGNNTQRALQRVMNSWYKYAFALPADRWSSHPLFNQLYEGQARRIAALETQQGVALTGADAERIAESARSLALRDTRKLIFDVAHQSDAAAALRLISPFFSATTNSWQRWGRIVADRPEVAGYAGKFFNAPLAMGTMQDKDGNQIDDQGYAYDPVTKQRTLVPKSERYIVGRLPKFLANGPIGALIGANPDTGDIKLSQNSLNLVLQGDPWFNPGTGPIVSIPVNEFVRDKPGLADMAQQFGVLPFGTTTSPTLVGRLAEQLTPKAFKDFLTAYDTSDYRYQQVKAQIMQRAAFEHANFGKPMPSASQLADQVKDYWLFTAASAFVSPVSGSRTDPYQFYRDEYNKMTRMAATAPKDQLGRPVGLDADSMFLDKYGESYFVFAQTMSQNKTGVPATLQAQQRAQKYADLIAQDPALAALIVGPEGNGPFSPSVYNYQLNYPLVPGGAEMQRTRLSADEAMTENQKRLGWAKYTARMNELNAQLVNRGLASFNDSGAEDLKRLKQGYTDLYTKPLLPDGSANKYFNQAFADDFNSQNTQKYNERIPALQSLARSPLAQDPARSDLRILQEYLGARQQVVQELASRQASGGSSSLTSRGNADLLDLWDRQVQQLILSNTSFGDLYHRYLSKDLQVDVAHRLEAEGAIGGSGNVGSQ